MPAGPIYSVADMIDDPHYQARGLFETVEVDGRSLRIPALPPFLSASPGRTDWAGPALGEHNDEVLRERLGLGTAEIEDLRARGVI